MTETLLTTSCQSTGAVTIHNCVCWISIVFLCSTGHRNRFGVFGEVLEHLEHLLSRVSRETVHVGGCEAFCWNRRQYYRMVVSTAISRQMIKGRHIPLTLTVPELNLLAFTFSTLL
jgi:hypothetical protein